jgi:hypothetical protein
VNAAPELLLVAAVAGVGVLHTLVPDHWVPIALIARQEGWSKGETGRAALLAGTGHVVSTLFIGLVVWIVGVAFAARFGTLTATVSSLALIAFGGWIAISSLCELRGGDRQSCSHEHSPQRGDARETHRDELEGGLHTDLHDGERERSDPSDRPAGGGTAVLTKHVHVHRHGEFATHVHQHGHEPDTLHPLTAALGADPPFHEHAHKRSARTALLLILGSSPMVEGIPAFFAAGKYGPALIAVMALVFAVATITTYVVLCVSSLAGLQRVTLGPLERCGEVLSGAFIGLVGVVFLVFPVL